MLPQGADGQEIACGDDQGKLIICGVDGQLKNSTTFDGGAVTALTAAGRGSWWLGQESGTVRLVESDGHALAEKTIQGPIWQLASTADGKSVAVASQRTAVLFFTLGTDGREFQESMVMAVPSSENATPRAIHAVQYSPSGEHLLAIDDLGRLTSFEVQSGSIEFVRDDQGVSQLSVTEMEHWPVPLRRRAAGIAFIGDGEVFVTAGNDTLIKAWRTRAESWKGELEVKGKPRMAFHPLADQLLWIGDGEGQLMLVDAQTSRICDTVQTGTEPITGLAVAKQTQLLATSSGHSVRFWHERNGRIEQRFTPISSNRRIESLALSQDGQKLAVYTLNGALDLWDVPTQRVIASGEFPHALGARLAFNSADDCLALLAGTITLILNGQDLQMMSQFQMAAGKGTALAWHPSNREMVFVGDALGRVTSRPEMDPQSQPEHWTENTPVIELVITSDGKRVLASTSAGRIVVIDHEQLGSIFSFDILGATTTSPVVSFAINRTGRFLATGREDGHVDIVCLADTELSQPVATRQWSERVCCAGAEAANIRVLPESVSIDERGYLHALYLQTDVGTDTQKPSWRLVLGRETTSGWNTLILQDYGPLTPRGVDAIVRSQTLCIDHDRWFAVAKFDVDATREHATSPRLIAGTIGTDRDTVNETIPLAFESQSGFDPFLILHDGSVSSVVHFSHGGHYLLLSTRSEDLWTTTQLGRQGDGFRFHAAADPERLHVLFRPTRFNADRGLPVLLDVLLNGSEKQPFGTRSHFSDTYRPTPLGLALSESGEPIVLYRTGIPDGPSQLRLARRQDEQWRHQLVFEREPPQLSALNLVIRPDGAVSFAAASQSDGRVWLVTIKDGSVTAELVWHDPGIPIGFGGLQMDCALKFTANGAPVVLVAQSAPQAGYIRTFCLDSPADNSPLWRP